MMETERLRLRPFTQEDAKRVQELAGDYEIARTTLSVPHPYPDGAAEAWINRLHASAEEGTSYGFAVERKEDHVLLGTVGLGVTPSHGKAELAYWIGRPYWSQGYTTEAALRVVQFGFEELSLNRIFAYAMSKNPASSRVMQKIGMSFEGTLRQHLYKWGVYEDLVAYGMLKVEYDNRGK